MTDKVRDDTRVCPRCGNFTMWTEDVFNARSRYRHGVYICEGCGRHEALAGDRPLWASDPLTGDVVLAVDVEDLDILEEALVTYLEQEATTPEEIARAERLLYHVRTGGRPKGVLEDA